MSKESSTISKNDFIEINFTGRASEEYGGGVFDSNEKEELEKLHKGHSHPIDAKPFVFSVGNNMFLDGIDNFLIGKEISKSYEIELSPEQAFGKRNSSLIRIIPMKYFVENKLNPYLGATFNLDGQMAKVLSVSGGRVSLDFNHPLAGKKVVYSIKVLKKVSNIKEKVSALMNFLFRREFNFEVDESKKSILITLPEKEKQFKEFLELFNDKFKEMLDLELTVEIFGKGSEKVKVEK